MKIYSKLSTLFQKLVAGIVSYAEEVAIQSYVPQDVIHYRSALRSLPETQFITGKGRAMEAVVSADFLPYYRAGLVATEDLSVRGASIYNLYIRLERRAERDDVSVPPLVGYFPFMQTQSEAIKENALQEWSGNDAFARSWLSRDLGAIPKNKWRRAPNEDSRQKSAPIP